MTPFLLYLFGSSDTCSSAGPLRQELPKTCSDCCLPMALATEVGIGEVPSFLIKIEGWEMMSPYSKL